jgi:hypothetical protein
LGHTEELSLSEQEQKQKQEELNKVIREIKFTDFLQQLMDYGNINVLRNFTLRLQMEEKE